MIFAKTGLSGQEIYGNYFHVLRKGVFFSKLEHGRFTVPWRLQHCHFGRLRMNRLEAKLLLQSGPLTGVFGFV